MVCLNWVAVGSINYKDDLRGRPPKFLEFYVHQQLMFYYISKRKFSKFEVLCPTVFFEKFGVKYAVTDKTRNIIKISKVGGL